MYKISPDYQWTQKLPRLWSDTWPSGLCSIKMLPVVGHVHGLPETSRVRAATSNVALTLMKYTHAYDNNMTCKALWAVLHTGDSKATIFLFLVRKNGSVGRKKIKIKIFKIII